MKIVPDKESHNELSPVAYTPHPIELEWWRIHVSSTRPFDPAEYTKRIIAIQQAFIKERNKTESNPT